MKTYEEYLAEAVAFHGHLCSGQAIGVRMAMYGMKLLGIDDPKRQKDLLVYIECDRCITDAIGSVTGCKLGKRTLKWFDYGKTAATFVSISSRQAWRIRRRQHLYPADGEDVAAFFGAQGDETLFIAEPVRVPFGPGDLPGRPCDAVVCEQCHEEVIDGKQIIKDGRILCKACATGGYYERC
ncbi:MAG: FmdE family protein [Lachnospiraceae bacterium]|nr:FmdE family protein [Lachnospiraceae bacterium]MDY5742131.1 FmdE family protein [Lachnospiraceae bacterium]